ncbi:hypothetical protein [Solirubrum puertoriconensis]|uniref:STAS/SEC14 domain-containing protein n=1 Tax=Solirubrum puertoriconensis TaxID=1751427 RepID=A0A9X0HPU1_SOLP1|nr:hypothetical protein [Solirubrum puertoriconensis]KUG09838.1 hypothetical protein ASU33_19410 [Solirubrum puertoriconensis]
MHLVASYRFLNLYLHEGSTRALEAQWIGFISSADLRQAVVDALEVARRNRVTSWIADDRQLGPVRPADIEWIARTALPLLEAYGITKFARVEATDPLNQLLINNTYQSVINEFAFELRIYTDLSEARSWAVEQ